jgi:ABC-2 type transport system ATP-binding protein
MLIVETPEPKIKSLVLTMEDVSIYAVDGRPLLEAANARFSPGVTALIGPNGSGKSTLLRALATLYPIETGSIALGEVDSRRNRRAFLDHIIFLPQNFTTYPDLTGQEFLEYSLQLRGAKARDARSIAAAWLEAVGLRYAAKTKTGAYSQGMRQRLGFAYVMQLDVSLCLLDEPFAGVDPETREVLTDLLFKNCSDRIAIASTHHVDEMLNRGAAVARLNSGTLVT